MKTKNKKHHLVAHVASLGSVGVSGITYRPVLPNSPLCMWVGGWVCMVFGGHVCMWVGGWVCMVFGGHVCMWVGGWVCMVFGIISRTKARSATNEISKCRSPERALLRHSIIGVRLLTSARRAKLPK